MGGGGGGGEPLTNGNWNLAAPIRPRPTLPGALRVPFEESQLRRHMGGCESHVKCTCMTLETTSSNSSSEMVE